MTKYQKEKLYKKLKDKDKKKYDDTKDERKQINQLMSLLNFRTCKSSV